MSTTLNFINILFAQARRCHDLGLHDEAKRRFSRLAEFRSLPAEVAEETQLRLADLCRDEDDCFKERQHLACALAQKPNDAEYHFRMAQAYSHDDDAPAEKAVPHFRAAVRVAPENPKYLAEFGSLIQRMGQLPQALRLLKRAHQLDESDLDILEQFADALVAADQVEEARRVLKLAMFRHASDPRYRDLYRQFQFREVAEDQANKASIPFPEEPAILPFVKPNKQRRFTLDGQIFRIDAPEPVPGPGRKKSTRKKQTP